MKQFLAVSMSLILMLFCAACGGAESMKSEVAYDMAYAGGGNNYSMVYEEAGEAEGMAAETSAGMTQNTAAVQDGRKLIKEVDMSIETKHFDDFIGILETEVTEMGGYLENSNIGGVSYNASGSNRSAWFTARIPVDQLETFVTKIGENGNVTNISRNVRDVTLEYVDVEGRITTLQAELARLNELLGQATSLEDILAIEAQISDVRYELESYQSQMNTYNNLIDYSTVYINVLEVAVISANRNESIWDQIRSGFEDSLHGVVHMIRDIFVTVITSIPYIVVFGAILVILIKLIRRRRKKKGMFKNIAMECEPESEETTTE